MSGNSISLFNGASSSAMDEAVLSVMRSGQIASGPCVAALELQLERILHREHVACTSDMTSALSLALRLANVGPGDEVLTLAYSCMSSNSPIALVGAKAVWVDIDPATASMSPEDLLRAITPRAKAVMLYHVAGYPGSVDEITKICQEHNLVLIEDCNNALGASIDGSPVGTRGRFAVHSFYPNRQINALEGGSLTCPDEQVLGEVRRLRRFGIDTTTFRDSRGEINELSDIPDIGPSAALSQLHAAVGLAHLEGLEARLSATRANAHYLARELFNVPGVTIVQPLAGAQPVYWGFLVLLEARDQVLAKLKQRGIQASILHSRNDRYTGFDSTIRELPGTDEVMARIVALPCGWWLGESEMQSVVTAVREECASFRTRQSV
ncbi:MAG: DegT/DnrJ/EryC1/StrS family aminotransferase [Burkholderiaceae bacterium]